MVETALTKDQITNAYRAERRALAQLVESLNEFHWGKESRAHGWTNGQVAAHLTLGDALPWRVALSIAFNGSINIGIELLQEKWAALGQDYVLERIKKDEVSIYVRWGVGYWRVLALAEIIIHGEDIRRSVDIPRARPPSPPLTNAILGGMGARLREIGLAGLVSVGSNDDDVRIYELNGKDGVKRQEEASDAPVKIIGSPLEQILRLSGREARLRVEGEGELADAARTWIDSKSDSGRLFYWK
jgi:hypothetical protein